MKATKRYTMLLFGILCVLNSSFSFAEIGNAPLSSTKQHDEVTLITVAHNQAIVEQQWQVFSLGETFPLGNNAFGYGNQITQLQKPVLQRFIAKRILLNHRERLAIQVFPFHFFF